MLFLTTSCFAFNDEILKADIQENCKNILFILGGFELDDLPKYESNEYYQFGYFMGRYDSNSSILKDFNKY